MRLTFGSSSRATTTNTVYLHGNVGPSPLPYRSEIAALLRAVGITRVFWVRRRQGTKHLVEFPL